MSADGCQLDWRMSNGRFTASLSKDDTLYGDRHDLKPFLTKDRIWENRFGQLGIRKSSSSVENSLRDNMSMREVMT